jgi:Leucine-rich repeat (LRR) protein
MKQLTVLGLINCNLNAIDGLNLPSLLRLDLTHNRIATFAQVPFVCSCFLSVGC